jgi:parvulin-like peptidyl-prolyl isomerase
MKKILFPMVILLMAASLLLVNCGGKSGDTVATIGSETISVETLKDDLLRAYRTPAAARKQTLETRLNILQVMITTQLKKLEASDLGLRELPHIQEKAKQYLEGEAMNRLYELEIINVIAGDEVIADFYAHDKKEVKAAHILLVWPQAGSAADSADVRQRADDIYQLALQGGDFNVLATEHTEEPGGDERGGDLGWFGWGRMTSAFQDVAWEMNPGEISQPVETRFGIHIIHLEEQRTKELPPLEDVRTDIQRNIMQTQRQQIAELVETFFVEMRADFQFSFTDKLDELLILLGETESEGNPFASFDEATKAWVIGTSSVGDITVRDMEDKVNERPRPGLQFSDRKTLEDLVDGIAVPMLLTELATQKGLLEDEGVVAAAELSLARDLEQELTGLEVDDRVNVTEEMIRTYFDENREQFINKPTVQVQEIFVTEETLAKQVYARARAGENFGALATKHTERSSAQSDNGMLPPFPPGRYGEMGEAAFNLEVGEIAGPIKLGSKFSVIKLISKTEATPRGYEESERQVRTMLETELRERAQQDLMDRLFEKFPVAVDTDRVQTLFM